MYWNYFILLGGGKQAAIAGFELWATDFGIEKANFLCIESQSLKAIDLSQKSIAPRDWFLEQKNSQSDYYQKLVVYNNWLWNREPMFCIPKSVAVSDWPFTKTRRFFGTENISSLFQIWSQRLTQNSDHCGKYFSVVFFFKKIKNKNNIFLKKCPFLKLYDKCTPDFRPVCKLP